MKGRYQKERTGKIFFKRLIIPFLVAFIAHCAVYGAFLKFKIPYFRSNDAIAHSNLAEQLEYDGDYDLAFTLWYPGYDYGHSGLEKTALVLDCITKEIIACNEMTLPDNKTLSSYLADSEKYKKDFNKKLGGINTLSKIDNTEEGNLFGMTNYTGSYRNVNGKNVIVFTVMKVNYYMYFFKYIFPVDLVLFFQPYLLRSFLLSGRRRLILRTSIKGQ